MSRLTSLLLVIAVLCGSVNTEEPDKMYDPPTMPGESIEVGDDSSGKMQKMSFSTPDLDEEEQHSNFMPDQLTCDACMAVAHQVC